MPTPTTQVTFGTSSTDAGVYAIVELDEVTNVDEDGNVLTTFLDSERVRILVHHEIGAEVSSVDTSAGSIINATTAEKVVRSKTIEDVAFKSEESVYQLQHFPVGGIQATWDDNEFTGTLSVDGRDVKCSPAPRVADITYQYEAWLYILQVDSLGLEQGEELKVDVSFDIRKI
jgi:hypothetical protein